MKYFLSILIVIAALVFLLTEIVSRNFKSDISTNAYTPTSTVQAAPTLPAPLPKQITPTDFHGPVGEPRIIGPSGNPPNY